MTSLADIVNLPVLNALAGRRRRRQAKATGAVIELNAGRPIVVQVCKDHRLRVGRDAVAALIGVPEAELEFMPRLLGVADVRLLLSCALFTPTGLPAARLLSALQGELRRAQGLLNLSKPTLRSALADADGAVLKPLKRRVGR